MTTLKDIAIKTGVSVRTVSRALKNDGYIKAEKKEEILKVAKELDYRINLMAQSIRTKKSYMIELIYPVGTHYGQQMPKVEAFENKMRKAGYRVSLFLHRFDAESSLNEINHILGQNPSGVALFAFKGLNDVLDKLKSQDIPYIVLDRAESGIDQVGMDRAQGIRKGLEHLIDKKRENIAYLGDANPQYYYGKVRLEAYLCFMKDAGLEPKVINIPTSNDNYHVALKVGSELPLDKLPNGIFAYTDLVALGFMQSMQDRGVKFPKDISMVGFNDVHASKYSYPSLTTIAHPNQAIGEMAAELLLAKINKEDMPEKGWSRELPGQLVIREST